MTAMCVYVCMFHHASQASLELYVDQAALKPMTSRISLLGITGMNPHSCLLTFFL